MNKISRIILIVLVALSCLCPIAAPAASLQATHLDKSKNPAGCAGCHKGHGKRGTAMLRTVRKEECVVCHGLPGAKPVGPRMDLYSVFKKRYNHPVFETSLYHSATESLPEKSLSVQRHVACQDCHNTHVSDAEFPWKKVKGYSRTRMDKKEAAEEYELCYRCHSDSANLPAGSTNKREEFSVGNASYHPIEASGRNKRVPSLRAGYDVSSKINCSDCHGNNDTFGARGPHGSDYEHILKYQYQVTEGIESQQGYALCYSCHDRRSILGNESFQRHKEHIVYYHVPCSACHTPHGTPMNQHLIQFSNRFVYATPMASYVLSNIGKPLCYLKCHVAGRDVMHDNVFYLKKKWR